MMLQQNRPDDYVIATGETRTVGDFLRAALTAAELEPNIEKYVDLDKEMLRPAEVDLLVGDAEKARSVLNWKPTKTFSELVDLMISNDLQIEEKTS